MKRNSEYIQPLAELMFMQLSSSMLSGSIDDGTLEDPNIVDWK